MSEKQLVELSYDGGWKLLCNIQDGIMYVVIALAIMIIASISIVNRLDRIILLMETQTQYITMQNDNND